MGVMFRNSLQFLLPHICRVFRDFVRKYWFIGELGLLVGFKLDVTFKKLLTIFAPSFF